MDDSIFNIYAFQILLSSKTSVIVGSLLSTFYDENFENSVFDVEYLYPRLILQVQMPKYIIIENEGL